MTWVMAAALAQGYSTNFDGGAPGWLLDAPSAGARWEADVTPAAFPGGPSRSGLSLNFNNGVDYAGCSAGGAVSPAIGLWGLPNPVLEFWCNYSTETRGTAFDRRTVEVWDAFLGQRLASWQLASVGYTFDPAGGLAGAGPGPCGEGYADLETGLPAGPWHQHRIFLDPAWGSVRIRFVFWSVDDLRNGTAGWAVDDLEVKGHAAPAPAGWPDLIPDTDTRDGDGNELDICQRAAGNLLRWSWGTSVIGSPGVHLVIGDHPESVLHRSFMFFDPLHNHWHMSQFTDVSLWRAQPFGFQKVARGPKRSFCLADVQPVLSGPLSMSPGCGAAYEAISYGWQDIYPLGTPGQEMDVGAVPVGTDYHLVAVLDPINRIRELDEMNQTDQIRFTLTSALGQVAILDRVNPFPPDPAPLSITGAAARTFQGNPAVQLLGAGFDTTITPVLYDSGTAVAEAPFYTIVSSGEMWVEIPAAIATVASVDLLRARGDAASFRLGAAAPVPCPPPADPAPLPVPADDGHPARCAALGLEAVAVFLLARRRAT